MVLDDYLEKISAVGPIAVDFDGNILGKKSAEDEVAAVVVELRESAILDSHFDFDFDSDFEAIDATIAVAVVSTELESYYGHLCSDYSYSIDPLPRAIENRRSTRKTRQSNDELGVGRRAA